MQHPRVLIIGSGLAGMTAAVLLSEAGHSVTVLEKAGHIGGRTASWTERGMLIESGLHRFLGFYTALPAILKKVGIQLDTIVCWEDEVEIRTPDGGREVLGAAPLHKPLKTARSLLGHEKFLSVADKVSLGSMFAAGIRAYKENPDALDHLTVADLAKKHNVTKRAMEHILIPLTEGIFFLPPQRYSAYNLFGLLVPYAKSLPKLRVGAFTGGMSEVMMQPMADFVQQHGGKVIVNSTAQKIYLEKGAVAGVIANNSRYPAEQVILAASLHGAQTIIAASFPDQPAFQSLLELPSMPAVTFQIELSGPSMAVDRTTFGPLTALASFAEQSRTTFPKSPGRLSIILTPPERFVAMPAAEILDIVLKDAGRLGIPLIGKVRDYRKVTLPHDFYSLSPGSEALRPNQKTPIPGLTLAGDYTKQPYLATMEGAVVSGRLAAKAVNGLHST